MKNKKLIVLILFVTLISALFNSISLGQNNKNLINSKNSYGVNYNAYYDSEIYRSGSELHLNANNISGDEELINNPFGAIQSSNSPPMDSPWPMYCHDVRHTGQSLFSTENNTGVEKWRFDTEGPAWGSPVIDDQGVVYIGANDIYAVYPNGTLKWEYDIPFWTESAPAIDENGVLYVGNMECHFYAIYTSNGTLRWELSVGNWVASSPAIGDDGCIYFGSEDDYIYAVYPNGTLKWKYLTGIAVYSDPAIGDDGTVYCGSYDGNLYALYPDNGTLKWRYQTGGWVACGPCIADDGTIYFGSWDGYLYAVYPDGGLKWKTGGNLAGTTPVIAQDGTIYVGSHYLSAIYPANGSVKWCFDPGSDSTIRGGNPCISADGTIFFGTHIGDTDGGELIAVNPNGTERWRIMLADVWIASAPAIGSDGTVYVGSCNGGSSGSKGYLHAVGPLNPNAPYAPVIDGPSSGHKEIEYSYTFKSISPTDKDVYYYIDWGDSTITNWVGPYSSGQNITINHSWSTKGAFTIKARAKDTENLWGPWSEYSVSITPRNRVLYYSSLLTKFLERFLLLQKLLDF